MVDATINVNVEANLGPLQTGLDRAKQVSQKADAELNKFSKTTKGVTVASAAMGKATEIATRIKTQFTAATANANRGLSQFRQSVASATQQMTGFGGAAGAAVGGLARLGASLGPGGLLVTGALALSLGIARLGENFVELRNQIAATPALAQNVEGTFSRLQDLADRTGKSLSTLTQEYVSLTNSNTQGVVTQERLTRAFERYNEVVAGTRQRTISDSFTRIKDQIVEIANNLDRAFNITAFWSGVLEKVSGALQAIRPSVMLDDIGQVSTRLGEVQRRMRELEEAGAPKRGEGGWLSSIWFGDEPERVFVEQENLLKRFKELQQQAFAPPQITRSPDQLMPMLESFNQSLMTVEQAERQSYERRRALLAEFQTAELVTTQQGKAYLVALERDYNLRMEQVRMQNAAARIQFENAAWQQGAELLSQFSEQSKVAALASLAISKGLAISQVAVSSAAAQVRALAELGPIAGPPAAAAISAYAKVQMALIGATGLMQGIQSVSPKGLGGKGGAGGGTGGTGGTSSETQAAAAPQAPATPAAANVLHISLMRHQRYTTTEVDELMQRIADRTKDGKTILKTELV